MFNKGKILTEDQLQQLSYNLIKEQRLLEAHTDLIHQQRWVVFEKTHDLSIEQRKLKEMEDQLEIDKCTFNLVLKEYPAVTELLAFEKE